MNPADSRAIKYAVVGIVIGLLSWSMYNLINTGISDFLSIYGIVNIYLQNTIIIVVCIIILLVAGVGGRKILRRVSS